VIDSAMVWWKLGGHRASACPEMTRVGQRTARSEGTASTRLRAKGSGPDAVRHGKEPPDTVWRGSAEANIVGRMVSRTRSVNSPRAVRFAIARHA